MQKQIMDYLREHESMIFGDLKRLVMTEASTSDIEELGNVRHCLKEIILERTDIEAEDIFMPGGHNVIHFEYGEGEEKIILVGHYDTVHPIGTWPIYEEDGKLYGPGIYDMKSGLISGIWCVRALKVLGIKPSRKLVFVFNGDEETGSGESGKIIAEYAKDAKAAIILEPATANGNLKTGRKGLAHFTINIHGVAAHAGNNHQGGINALEEMAHEILYIQTLTDYEKGTTANVGVCQGGTKSNVVPAFASIDVDTRFKTTAERQRLHDEIYNMKTTVPGTTREVVSGSGKSPMEESEGNMKLFELAYACGQKLGLELGHEFVGGGSDGNEISAMGIPTIDGMGAVGNNAHAKDEYIVINEYINRIALVTLMMTEI